MNKISQYISRIGILAKTQLNKMRTPIKWVIVCYFLLVVLLVLTYYAAWLYQSWAHEIVLQDLMAVIQELIGPAMIGFVTFIGGCFVDINNNGIPDSMEEKENGHQ